jgi:hypothetical protein
MRARKSRGEWAGLIAEFEASGESVERFCGRRRIAPATFRWWRWRLPAADTTSTRAGRVQLVAVDVAASSVSLSSSSRSTLEIAVAGVNVHVEVGTDPGYVAALVTELRRRC